MHTIEAIKARRSIKHFDAEHQLSAEEINTLLTTALEAPTSFNVQHWRFVMVDNPAVRAEIRKAAKDQAQVTEASVLIIICADTKAWQSPQRYWKNAPQEVQDIIIPMIKPFYDGKEQLQRDEAQRSIGIVAQTMMLTAKAMGYDSCPMIGFNQDKVAEIINLPENYVVGLMLVVGKAVKGAWPKPGQLPLDEVLVHNKFA